MTNNNRNQQLQELSKITANSIVAKVLKKHGLEKSLSQKVTEADRNRVRTLVDELQKQAASFTKKTTDNE